MAERHRKPGAAARHAAANAFGRVVGASANMEEALASGSAQLEPRDRGLARAIATTALRHRAQLLAMLGKCWDRPPPKRARYLNNVLETAAAQMVFMAVPHTAAVDIAIDLIGSDPRSARFKGFANAVLRRLGRESESLSKKTDDVLPFPKWLSSQLRADHGKARLSHIADAFRQEPHIDLCFRGANATLPQDIIRLPGNAARLTTRESVEAIRGYADGAWWVQDFAAQQPVRILNALLPGGVSGMSIADLCAAPGGKTMQLASMGADVTAIDIASERMAKLEENLARTCLNARIVIEDVLSFEPEALFDGILLDAPCSATGTIRRNPDIVWNTQPDDIDKLVGLQKQLIERAATWLKPGGVLVYANCSMLKAEGEDLVAALERDGNLTGLGRCDLRLEIDSVEMGIAPLINGRGDYRTLLHDAPLPELQAANQTTAETAVQAESETRNKPRAQPLAGMDGFFACAYRRP